MNLRSQKVTIMIPTFNQEVFLSKAIESGLSQTYQNLEVIVSDDNSTDKTFNIISRYKNFKNFFYFKNDKNEGRVSNYQKLLYKYSKGDWVLNLDGDDYLIDKYFIENAMDIINYERNLVGVIGGIKILEPNSLTRDLYPTRKNVLKVNGYDFFLNWTHHSIVPHLGFLYNRTIAIKLNFYSNDILAADWESLRKLVLNGDVILLGKIIGVWRSHPFNASKNISAEENIRNLDCITVPYDYACKRKLDFSKLTFWLEKSIYEYFETYINFSIHFGNLSEFVKFSNYLRKNFPFVFWKALARFSLNFRLLFKLSCRLFGGKSFLKLTQNYWRKLFWDKSVFNHEY